MAAFAVNIRVLMEHPTARMGFKPDNKKRSLPGYIEPDFLKMLGAQRDTVECRGASDEVRVCRSFDPLPIIVKIENCAWSSGDPLPIIIMEPFTKKLEEVQHGHLNQNAITWGLKVLRSILIVQWNLW